MMDPSSTIMGGTSIPTTSQQLDQQQLDQQQQQHQQQPIPTTIDTIDTPILLPEQQQQPPFQSPPQPSSPPPAVPQPDGPAPIVDMNSGVVGGIPTMEGGVGVIDGGVTEGGPAVVGGYITGGSGNSMMNMSMITDGTNLNNNNVENINLDNGMVDNNTSNVIYENIVNTGNNGNLSNVVYNDNIAYNGNGVNGVNSNGNGSPQRNIVSPGIMGGVMHSRPEEAALFITVSSISGFVSADFRFQVSIRIFPRVYTFFCSTRFVCELFYERRNLMFWC